MSKKQKQPVDAKPPLVSAVLYTDGGCLLNEGMAGWGVHGFTFDANAETPKSFKQIGATTTRGYVDAKDFEKRGVKPVNALSYVDGWGSLNNRPTNNTAELTASIQGLKVVDRLNADQALILTDSEYVIKGLYDYSPKWIAQNWIKRDGEPVKNKELWQQLIKAKEQLESTGIKLDFKWVKGHSGEIGNESADKLATRGRSYCGQFAQYPEDTEFFSYSEATGYWSPKVKYNRFFFLPCWYFITNAEEALVSKDGRNIYLLGKHGDDDQFGKRVADHCFAVVLLKERDASLDLVRTVQNKISEANFSEVVIGYIDTILTPRVNAKIHEFGKDFLLKLSHHNNLFTPDQVQVTQVCDPPRQTFRGLERLNNLYLQLEAFLAGELGNLVTTDITGYLYEQTEVKGKAVCKLSSKVAQSTKSIRVMAQHNVEGKVDTAQVSLTLGIDLPGRNALNAFAEQFPKVTLLTQPESDFAFRFAVVIQAGDDVAIVSSLYSNLKIKL